MKPNTQYLYVILDQDNRFLNDLDGVWWATYFTEAKVFENLALAERVNERINGKIHKVIIKPEPINKT